MPIDPKAWRPRNALSLKIGRWAEASATGWGILALLLLAGLFAAVVVGAAPLSLPR